MGFGTLRDSRTGIPHEGANNPRGWHPIEASRVTPSRAGGIAVMEAREQSFSLLALRILGLPFPAFGNPSVGRLKG
jgi:hypothetical protein